ncbi:MAG: addiction module protein [Pseudomonadota bacterium]|nr:addiction module protein [Pseudomonadota bacterium]
MHRNIEELTSELIRLPKRERLEIVRFLLFLDNHSSDSSDVSSAWEDEITNRVQAVEDGAAIGIDYDNALRTIESRFAS